jgi:hypothetical protein
VHYRTAGRGEPLFSGMISEAAPGPTNYARKCSCFKLLGEGRTLMSRGLSMQQQHIVATIDTLIDGKITMRKNSLGEHPVLRKVTTYEIVEALCPATALGRNGTVVTRGHLGGRSRTRPIALLRGTCSPSQFRSLQRALLSLVRRGSLQREKGFKDANCWSYTTEAEYQRSDEATSGLDGREASFSKLNATIAGALRAG